MTVITKKNFIQTKSVTEKRGGGLEIPVFNWMSFLKVYVAKFKCCWLTSLDFQVAGRHQNRQIRSTKCCCE